ncbi:MAG: hypothetical protein WA790_14010 [Sulfitobacter sp.]
MTHLQPFVPRKVLALPMIKEAGWTLKRYAILADGRVFDESIVSAASAEMIKRMPRAGDLEDGTGNHGVGFQIIHFAQVAVVSPVFYWQWGSVLARADQMRADWETPTVFGDGVKEVLGCVWEMDVVSFEVNAWKTALLEGDDPAQQRLAHYLKQSCGQPRDV